MGVHRNHITVVIAFVVWPAAQWALDLSYGDTDQPERSVNTIRKGSPSARPPAAARVDHVRVRAPPRILPAPGGGHPRVAAVWGLFLAFLGVIACVVIP